MKTNHVLETVNNERGNILVLALLLVFAICIVGGAVTMMSSTDTKISSNQELGTESQFVAEAGVAEAIHRLSVPYPTNATIGGQQVNISIADTAPLHPDYKAYIQLKAPGANPTFAGNTMTAGTLQDLGGDFLDYSKASGTTDVLTVEHKWKDLNGNGVRDAGEIALYDSDKNPPENYTTGNPIEVITVTGESGTAKRSVQVEVTRKTVKIRTLGALYTDKAATVSGSSQFCGWNHSATMPNGVGLNACYAYHQASGNLAGVTTTGDVVTQKGSNKTDGSPPTNTDPANPWYSLAETLGISQSDVNALLAKADHTSVVNNLDGVTYIQGNAKFNAQTTGHGLAYITGDLTINGGFTYWGLIYVEGDCKITGTPWILGSVMVKGTADNQFSAGNCGIYYSADALSQYVNSVAPMITLAWRQQ